MPLASDFASTKFRPAADVSPKPNSGTTAVRVGGQFEAVSQGIVAAVGAKCGELYASLSEEASSASLCKARHQPTPRPGIEVQGTGGRSSLPRNSRQLLAISHRNESHGIFQGPTICRI